MKRKLTHLGVNLSQFRKSDVIADTQSNFTVRQVEGGKTVARRKAIRLSEDNTTGHVDVKHMYLNAK